MSKILSVIVVTFGAILGLYLGVYVMLVGGIEQIVDALNEDPVLGSEIAWGVVKIIFASFIGWLSFFICFALGAWLWDSSDRKGKHYRKY